MKITGFNRSGSPERMGVSAIDICPDFTLNNYLFGFESGFYRNNAKMTKAQMIAKGVNLQNYQAGGTRDETLLTVGANMTGNFGTNAGAYQTGQDLGGQFKYLICDFENQYGGYDNGTSAVDRVGNFIKGATDAGALVGEYLWDMFVWNEKSVFQANARTQISAPVVSGIGLINVPSLNRNLASLYNLFLVNGYGSGNTAELNKLDPRTKVYNAIYQFRVYKSLKAAGLIPHVQKAFLYMWAPVDPLFSGIPAIKHRIYLDAPYANGNYVWINGNPESDPNTMKGLAMWSVFEGSGAFYWDTPGILTSNTKNDIVDIALSGHPDWGHVGGAMPNSRPDPNRMYPYLDGLGKDATWEGMYEASKVQYMLDGVKSDPDFAYKNAGSVGFTNVVKPTNGTGIVDDFEQQRPVVGKVVKGSEVLFLIQHPFCMHGTRTQIKISHGGKSWLVTTNGNEPAFHKFSF